MVWENVTVVAVAIAVVVYVLLMVGLYHMTPQKSVMRLRSQAIIWLTVAAIVEALDIFVTVYQLNGNERIYDDFLGNEKTLALLTDGKMQSFYVAVVFPMIIILVITVALLLLVLVYGQRYSSQLTLAQNNPALVGGKKKPIKVNTSSTTTLSKKATKGSSDETKDNSTVPSSLMDFQDDK